MMAVPACRIIYLLFAVHTARNELVSKSGWNSEAVLSQDTHDGFVARLYASALGDVPWTDTLQHLAELFGGYSSLVQTSDAAGRIMGAEIYGYSKKTSDDFYSSGAYANDPRTPYFLKVEPGSVYYDRALYDVDEMLRNPWVRNSVDILKVIYQLGAVVSLPTGAQGMMTVLKSERDGHATEAEICSYRRLLPHIEQACALGHVLDCRAATQEALLDALVQKADGVILLDRAGIPTFMNDSAQAILAAGDGLGYSRGAFLTARGPETRRLQQLIGAATTLRPPSEARPGGQMLVTRISGKRPYVLRIMPAPPMERFLTADSIACLIHLHDLASLRPPSRVALLDVFGLTEREADLAIELMRCTGLDGAAANARMALNTARNHLQSIFRKTGTANQAEAVQLFGRLG